MQGQHLMLHYKSVALLKSGNTEETKLDENILKSLERKWLFGGRNWIHLKYDNEPRMHADFK